MPGSAQPACTRPESGFFAGELAIGESRSRTAMPLEQIDQIHLRRPLIGASAVVIRDLVACGHDRLSAVVGGGARRLAVVAPARVERAQLIDDVIEPGIVHVFPAGGARLRDQFRPRGVGLLYERSNVR